MFTKSSHPNANQNLEKFAGLISVVLGQQFWAPLLLVVFIFTTGLSTHQMVILMPILLLLQIVIPTIYIRWAIKTKRIQSWDIPKREERYELWILLCLTSFLSAMITNALGTPLAFKVMMILFALLTALVLISLVWKISFHMISAVGSSLLINYLTGNGFLILYLGIPLVFWSRWVLRRHTISQLVAGSLVSYLIVEGGLLLIQS